MLNKSGVMLGTLLMGGCLMGYSAAQRAPLSASPSSCPDAETWTEVGRFGLGSLLTVASGSLDGSIRIWGTYSGMPKK